MQYSGQTQIAQALSEKSELWRIIVGFFLATAIYLGLLIVAFFCIALLTDISQTASIVAELRSMDAPRSVLLALYSFSAMIFGVTLASWVLHRQSIFKMVGQPKIIFYDFVRVVRILLILNLAVLAAGWGF